MKPRDADRQIAVTIGDALRFLRHRAKLTQPQAAAAVGVAQSTWSLWERGRVCPRVTHLDRVADAFGVTRQALVTFAWE